MVLVTFFPVTFPVSETFAYLALVVSDMLLFWCSWFNKLDLVTVGKFCFHFSRVLGSVVDCVNVNLSAHVALKPCLA